MPSLLNQLIYKETKAAFEGVSSVVFINYDKYEQDDLLKVRSEAKAADAGARVVKNSILLKVFKELGVEDLDTILSGQVLAISGDDVAGVTKAATKVVKELKKGKVLGGVLDGVVINSDQVKELSNLPSREVLIGQVLGLLVSPIRGLVTVLDANISGFARVLNAVKEKKEQEASA